jgi:hypothetical protein
MRKWVAVLLAAAALVLGFTFLEAARARRGPGPGARDFQRLAGGLGMGAATVPYWDFSTFDPRLEPDCACTLWPVPGGFLFSPEHRATIFDPPETLGPAGRERQGGAP